jgi:hypothetical protein
MNRIASLFTMILLYLGANGQAQISYSLKVETGFLKYQNNTVQIDPGPNWKGYNLYEENGLDINIVNGLEFKNRVFAGIGLGYLNFEGISGLAVFSDFEYLPLKTRVTPIINLKIGFSHIWNQYENGTGTGLGELCIGLNYRLSEKTSIYTKSGVSMTQQSLLIPIRFGVRF